MSICRFSEGDVYVFYDSVAGGIACAWCRLCDERTIFRAVDEREMIVHLNEHKRADHLIPDEAFEHLANPHSDPVG